MKQNERGTAVAALTGVSRYRSEFVARQASRERFQPYGFCPLDGMYYVGDTAELLKVCVNIGSPYPLEPRFRPECP